LSRVLERTSFPLSISDSRPKILDRKGYFDNQYEEDIKSFLFLFFLNPVWGPFRANPVIARGKLT
jgi:hypothetical protein